MRKRLLLAFSVFALLFLLILIIPSVFKKQVANVLRNQLNQSLEARVSFKDADINLWRNFPHFTVSLDEFVVAGRHEFTGDTLIRTSNLHLTVSSWKLITNKGVEIRDLKFVEPVIHVVILKNGKTNYDIVSSDTLQTDSEVALKVESWQVEAGKFLYDDRSNDIMLRSNGTTLQGNIDIKGSVTGFTIAAVSESFTSYYENKRYIGDKAIVFNLEGTYDSKTSTVTFSDNAVAVNNLNIGFSGTVQFNENDQAIDLKFRTAEAAFSDILSLSQAISKDFNKLDIKGTMALEGQVLGTLNTDKEIIPAFKMNLVVQEGSIKYQSLTKSLNEINFDLAAYNTDGNLDNTIIALQYFGMKIGENPVFGSGEIQGFRNGKVTADIMAKIPLSDLASIFPMDSVSMEGDLDFSLKANGPYSGSFFELRDSKNWTRKKIPAFHLDLQLANGGLKYDHLPEAISDLQVSVTADNTTGILDHTSLKISKLSGMLGDNPIKGAVNISGISEPTIAGSLKAHLNLADVRDFYPIDGLTLRGKLDVDMKIDGKLSDSTKTFPRVFAHVDLSNGFIQSREYPAPMEETHLVMQALNETGKFADTKMIIDTLTYSIEDESFFITGSLQDLDRYVYDLEVKGVLYLDKIKKILRLEDMEMSGEVDLDVITAGNVSDLKAKNYHRLPTKGQLKMKNVYFNNALVPHGLTVASAHMFFSNEKLTLDTLYGSLGESKFHITGHLTNYLAYAFHNQEKITGDLLFESDNFDINELLVNGAMAKDTVHHDLSVISIPGNIDFTFDSKIDHLKYQNLTINNLNGEIIVRDGVLTLNKTSFDALDASFQLSGDYDPRDAERPKFDFSVGIHELDITKAHEAFVTVQSMAPAAEHTYGIFSVDYKLKGELHQDMFPALESLSGGGTVRIRDAQINGMKLFQHISGITKKEELQNPKLKDIVMETTVENGVLFVKPFSMKLAGFDTDIEGRHELTGNMNYILKIALPPFDLIKVPLHVDGTYDKPKVHLGKGHEDTFKKAATNRQDPKQKNNDQDQILNDPSDHQTQDKSASEK